ncbi:putative membrane protein [Sphingomonas sp. BE123]|uniref:DUF4126 family protein n=1 Tax=Sphingomonas sp. BE123 TaxID=2817842 RepID=UPI002859B9E7|nr:DUF4126 family protein [Sphingomonas sp. BE123]MDR6853014.1 putative membrane protein [Sphingomonas sp. BE123]
MLRSILLGAAAGARAMTPLAVVANAARTGKLRKSGAAPDLLAHPLVSAGTTALAVYELIGDKHPDAPDRISAPAAAVRIVNAAIAGALVAPKRQRWAGAAAAGATAAVATYLTWRARTRAMAKHSGEATGFVEDAIVVPAALAAATAR